MKKKHFTLVKLLVVIAIPAAVSLPAAEFTASQEQKISTSDSAAQAAVGILEPDIIELSIDYTWSHEITTYGNGTMNGRLVMMTDIPTFTIGGPTTFTDGTIATQTFNITFQGIWQLDGASIFFHRPPGTVYTGEVLHMDYASLTFGLTEDTGEGAFWRLISGTLPEAVIHPPEMGGGGIFIPFDNRKNISRNNDNDLAVNIFWGDDYSYAHFHQTLSQALYRSPYPAFSFVSHYGATVFHAGTKEVHNFSCALVLHTYKNQEDVSE